ncbi:unnamed protein product [Arctia plantaginis]|uniref:Uncharacterized protein n=1 Tax=Arctia plantaginis TaxID=874455 RepID=A0A8S1AQI6_ARCPL|nr:unnamed protein product [Arctia plantaginis]CAB3255661.1 unnamed protein product [Arctia plantaginis]
MPKTKGGGDQVCTLECVKKGHLQQFEGPVKIIVVEPSINDLFKRILESSLLAFCHLFIGAAVCMALYFSYICRLPIFISAHIAACTTGFQLFLPSAFLILNPYFGASIQLKNRQRKSQHAYLTHLTLIFGLTGGLHILCYIVMSAFPYNPHTITGLLTLISSIPAFFIGPLLYHTGICSPKEAITLKKIKNGLV